MQAIDELLRLLEISVKKLKRSGGKIPRSLLKLHIYCDKYFKKNKFEIKKFEILFKKCKSDLLSLSENGYLYFEDSKQKVIFFEKMDNLEKQIFDFDIALKTLKKVLTYLQEGLTEITTYIERVLPQKKQTDENYETLYRLLLEDYHETLVYIDEKLENFPGGLHDITAGTIYDRFYQSLRSIYVAYFRLDYLVNKEERERDRKFLKEMSEKILSVWEHHQKTLGLEYYKATLGEFATYNRHNQIGLSKMLEQCPLIVREYVEKHNIQPGQIIDVFGSGIISKTEELRSLSISVVPYTPELLRDYLRAYTHRSNL